MAFWIILALEVESAGELDRWRIGVNDKPFQTLEDATQSLADREPLHVAFEVRQTMACVVEADSFFDAGEMMKPLRREGTIPEAALLVRRDFATHYEPAPPPPAVPPEVEAIHHLHGELCISHQLVEIAVRCATSEVARADLEQHWRAVEDLGFGLRVLQADLAGEERPVAVPEMGGQGKLGYGHAQVDGSEDASFGSALSSLVTELSIAVHQARQTEHVISRPEITAIGNELQAFQASVEEWGRRAG